MATLSSLVERVRMELGDLGQSFVETIVSDGSTERFQLQYSPLNGESLVVIVDSGTPPVTDISATTAVEEQSGVLVLAAAPAAASVLTISGTHYRYFTNAEIETILTTALAQHSARRTDSLGRDLTLENLPFIEEYPVAIYATTLALYTLATDAAFDIDIQAPDGVTIPRSERYRQLMEMIQQRQEQYKELCVQLGIGMYSIDVFTFRRKSKMTGRYVPVFTAQEVDDRSWPKRADIPLPTYGSKPVAWPTDGGDLTAYQTIAWTDTVTFSGNYGEEANFYAKIIHARGSLQQLQPIAMDLSFNAETNTYTAVLSLTADQTRFLYKRTYWQILVEPTEGEARVQVIGGDFYTERVRESWG